MAANLEQNFPHHAQHAREQELGFGRALRRLGGAAVAGPNPNSRFWNGTFAANIDDNFPDYAERAGTRAREATMRAGQHLGRITLALTDPDNAFWSGRFREAIEDIPGRLRLGERAREARDWLDQRAVRGALRRNGRGVQDVLAGAGYERATVRAPGHAAARVGDETTGNGAYHASTLDHIAAVLDDLATTHPALSVVGSSALERATAAQWADGVAKMAEQDKGVTDQRGESPAHHASLEAQPISDSGPLSDEALRDAILEAIDDGSLGWRSVDEVDPTFWQAAELFRANRNREGYRSMQPQQAIEWIMGQGMPIQKQAYLNRLNKVAVVQRRADEETEAVEARERVANFHRGLQRVADFHLQTVERDNEQHPIVAHTDDHTGSQLSQPDETIPAAEQTDTDAELQQQRAAIHEAFDEGWEWAANTGPNTRPRPVEDPRRPMNREAWEALRYTVYRHLAPVTTQVVDTSSVTQYPFTWSEQAVRTAAWVIYRLGITDKQQLQMVADEVKARVNAGN